MFIAGFISPVTSLSFIENDFNMVSEKYGKSLVWLSLFQKYINLC